VDEARAVCDAALAQSRVRGDVVGEAVGRALAAMAALRAGDVPDCESNVRAALSLPDVSRVARSAMHVLLARALVERGELDAAERALEEGGVGPQLPVLTPVNGGFHARGLLRIAQGRDDEALADLMEFGARSTACMVRNAANPWRVDAALTCRRLGRSADARSLLDDHDAAAARWGAPVATASGLAGRAAGLRGPAQLALLESARELLATSSCRLDYAKVLFDLGVALRRAGRRRDAQRRLSEAAALATRCGATALATRANDDLRILTAPARRLQFSGVDSLTASERRIALMAAEGMSNSQIAQAVFVTCKTVENHLGNVYMKLAINSRRQLETELGQVGQRAA
jgi:DNA-binding CsgD family transcriptional regulator